MLRRNGRTRCFNVVAILLCLSVRALAQGPTEPVKVVPVGPQGGMVNSIVVDPQDSSTVYAASSTGVSKSSDGGTTWSYSALTGWDVSRLAIDPERPATIYAWGQGNLFKSLDAGASWNHVPGMPLNLGVRAVDPRSQGTLYGTIGPSGLFKSNDGGETWQSIGAEIPNTSFGPVAIDPRDPNTVYVTGFPTLGSFSLSLFKSTDGGISFSQLASGLSDSAVGLAIDPNTTSSLYITTGEAGVIKSTDGGSSWGSVNVGLPPCCLSPVVIDPQNTATLYVVRRDDGRIFQSTNGGQSWILLANDIRANSVTIDPVNSNTLYASSSAGALKSTNVGASWSAIDLGLHATSVVSAAIDPQNPDVLYVGTSFSGVFRSADKGKTWASRSAGINFGYFANDIAALAVDPQTPGTLYAGTNGEECGYGGGAVFKSVDAGMNWANNGELYNCISSLVIDPQNPATIYAGTWYGWVFKSTDGGESWNVSNSGLLDSYVDALALDVQNPQTLYASVYVVRETRSALFKTTDGGATWYSTGLSVDKALISKVTIDPQNTGTVYAVTAPFAGSGGTIWKSIDGGASWQDLSPGLPSPAYAVAADLRNSASIYAGTDLGVITSVDGGASWTLLTSDTGRTQLLIPGPGATLYAGGPGGLFAIDLAPPTVTAVTFDVRAVRPGASYTATVTGSNLTNDTYFDVQARPPTSAAEIVVFNWQTGTSQSHSVPTGTAAGTWTIIGVRAHQDTGDHTGNFVPVSAAITVSP